MFLSVVVADVASDLQLRTTVIALPHLRKRRKLGIVPEVGIPPYQPVPNPRIVVYPFGIVLFLRMSQNHIQWKPL